MHSGVVDEAVPCVVTVVQDGVVGSVGVGLFDALVTLVSVALVVGLELVESGILSRRRELIVPLAWWYRRSER